ncbi:hypothetical protein JI76_28435 [Streptomyces anulatus]|uniref:hypothetical protein n=1 Tax=Streptomyces anulatus TaxID=1892 RepID=UPI0006DA29E2|nr:hypothetical protein [Streptomyces anulatus]KPL29055.1 hypothetical protein JI76_28435 [Streptomyces anulatus]
MTGQVQAHLAAVDRAVQTAYTAFIQHTQLCAPCRKDGADCATAATLRQAWRDAKTVVPA